MDEMAPRTDFVRKRLLHRRYEPDEGYAEDLIALERLAGEKPLGFASSLALSNLMSRYPGEADGILRELGVRPLADLEAERVRDLTLERLRLAEARHPRGRLRRDEPLGLFEF